MYPSNFGMAGLIGFTLLVWAIPLLLLFWFMRMLTAMAASLREIVERLGAIERAVRDAGGQYKPPV